MVSVDVTTTLDIAGIVATNSYTSETSEGNNANYLTIRGCTVTGGEKCISLEGGGNDNPNMGNAIIDCDLSGADDYGIYYDDQTQITISGNNIHDLINTGADGIYGLGGYSSLFEKNKIDVPDYGIYLVDQNVNGLPVTRTLLVNNMVRSTGDYGVYLNDVDSLFMYHNTVVGEPALYVNDQDYLDLRNNIFYSIADQAVDFIDATPIGTMDYNLYYTATSNVDMFEFGTNSYADLAAWQTAQGTDAHSVQGDPVFAGSNDLHILGLLPNDIGDPSLGITEDIDGDPRPFSPAVDVDLGADEIKILNNDAGVVSLQPVCVGGDLEVTVRNFGALNLGSFTVNWTIDGVTQTPVSISGSSLSNQMDTLINLGPHNFAGNQTYDVKVWASQPNGVNDPDKTNDSVVVNGIRTGLDGTYTVGGTGADFASLSDAVDALKDFGMCGSVELSINNGTYTEMVSISNILKGDPSYDLQINSVSGNPDDVRITSVSGSSSDNYTIAIEGMDNVTLENLTIERTGTATLGVAIYLEDADSVTIRNNKILGDSSDNSSNTTGSRSGIFSDDLGAEHNLLVENNIFSGNANGMWISGGVAEPSENLIIRNNSFSVAYTAIYTLIQASPEYRSNYITTFDHQATTSFYGLSMNEITGTPVVEGNEVIGHNSPGYGIRFRNALCDPNNKGMVVNNMVQLNGTTTAYGFSLETSSGNIRFIHNTGYIKGGTSTASRPFYSTAADGDNELLNNIFMQKGNGYAFYITSSSTGTFSRADYNMLYSTGSNLAYWNSNRGNLADVQSASSMFDRSVVQEIDFVSNENLRINDFEDVLVGTPLGITTDIDGNSRCAVPYTGAYEVAPLPKPLTVDFSVPDTLYAGGRGLFINSALRSERRIHEWFLDGSSVSTDLNLLQEFANAGTYEVKLISEGCFTTDSAIKNVTVIAPFDIPEVDFTTDRTKIFAGDFVTLIDLSTQAPTGWFWTVDPSSGVSIGTQFSQDPTVFFSEPGVYDVCLTADNGFGSGTQVCKDGLIEVYPVSTMCTGTGSSSPVGKLYDDGGAFGAYSSSSDCRFVIDPCADEVTAVITAWDVTDPDDHMLIYDGTTEDPNHLLATFTSVSVNPGGTAGITASSGAMLIVWRTDASTTAEGFAIEWTSTANSQVQQAGFSVTDTAFAGAPVFVQDMSQGAKLTRTWDMDLPNMVDITRQGDQLLHVYANPGTYAIRQIIDGCDGMDTSDRQIVIIAPTQAPSPVDFEVNRRTLTFNDILEITDHSGNGPDSWRWEISPATGVDFMGTENDPVARVRFSQLGTYDIKLVVSNVIGSDSIVKTAHVQVVDYCTPNAGLLSSGLGISRVRFAGIDQFSTIGENAFTDYTESGQSARVGLGESYDIEIYRNATTQAMSRKVWIDWNQDGDFADAGELVAQEGASFTSQFTASIQVPNTATMGITRMRVAGGYSNDPASPCGPSLIGEFEDYRVEILGDISKPVITLLGNNPETIEAGYGYNDAGATAFDQVDGNITGNIMIQNMVDTLNPGTYFVAYWVMDAAGNYSDTVYRQVNVTPDVTAPLLIMLGNATESIEVHNTYNDPGVDAIDNPWGISLNGSVQVSGSVDTAVLGTYTLTYTVMDMAGNSSSIDRSVVVFDSTAPAITLNVDDTLYVEVNTSFIDPGISITDNHWTVFSQQVTGTVDVTTPGTYTLSYTATDGSSNVSASLDRVVIVRDATAPMIELVGNELVYLARWQTYADSGYVLSDNYNDSEDVTVEVLGDWVNSSVEGLFYLQYKATDVSGNVSYSAKRVIDVRGTNSVRSIDEGWNVYPNPTSGVFEITFENLPAAGSQLVITDALGKTVYSKVLNVSVNSLSIDLSGMKPGTYFIRVTDGQTQRSGRIQLTR